MDSRELPPGAWLGEYEIVRLLGDSSDSLVYLAQDHGLQRQVALREYLPRTLARRSPGGEIGLVSAAGGDIFSLGLRAFAHEARLLARCEHPALVKVLRYWEAQHTGYMVLRWYEGESLLAWRNSLRQPPGEAWLRTVLLDLLGALEALHAAFAQHREITPRNILVQPDDRPVLLGFHAARRVLAEHGGPSAGAGISDYAPIEAHPDGSHLQQGPWSDLYSLTAVMYFCLTGTPPPPATARMGAGSSRPLSAAARALCDQHPGLQYSPGFLTALDWAFELLPQHRPRSVAEWRAVVQQTALSGGAGRVGNGSDRAAPVEPTREMPPPVPAGAAVLPLRSAGGGSPEERFSPRPPPVSKPAAAERSSAPRPAAAPARSPVAATDAREPVWTLPAGTAAPSSDTEPSEEAVRAALAAALGSLPPETEPPPGVRRPAGPSSPPRGTQQAVPRRWLGPAIAALALMAAAAGWQWKQQRDTQELSRAMAGAAAPALPASGPASPEPPPAVQAEAPRPTEEPAPTRDASNGVPTQPEVAEVVPPVNETGDAQDRESVPPGTDLPAEIGRPPDEGSAASGAPSPAVEPDEKATADSSDEAAATPRVDATPSKAKAKAPPPAPSRIEFSSPRAACAPRERFSLYYCMQQECKKPQFQAHRQCKALRERDEIE